MHVFTRTGDSITERGYNEGGWVGRLAQAYSRKVREQLVSSSFIPKEATSCVVPLHLCIWGSLRLLHSANV